ncbi:MAG: hypothetical protein JEZ03_06000 [Bacteroidales bacterium]|nr:hypothetical protein [Bacteroidales bacterium]
MKNLLLKKSLIATLAVSMFMLVGCSKEKMAAKKIEGDWNATSVTIDDEDVLIDGVTIKIEFEEYNDHEGDVDFTFIINIEDGEESIHQTQNIPGEYTINKDADEIEFDFGVFGKFDSDFDLEKDDLELEFTSMFLTSENAHWVIKAKRD